MEQKTLDIAFMKNKKNQLIKLCKSPDYNYLFNLKTGYFLRWGATEADDPEMSPAPEILDIEITTICGNGCPFCSPAGTMVNTPNGKVPIEEIVAGDTILSYNIKEKRMKENLVEETYAHNFSGELICITDENGNCLQLTPEHPVYTNQGWIEAKDLKEGIDVICLK